MTMAQRLILAVVVVAFFFGVEAKFYINNDTVPPNKEKIIGGEEVDIESYPFQVGLLMARKYLMCSGSIITPRHILTSAHCFEKFSNPKFWAVRSGSSYTNRGGILSEISKIIGHEDFNHTDSDPEYDAYDIAIVVLKKPLEYNSKTQEIPLISRDVQEGEEAYASGWGRTQPYSGGSEKLKALRLWVDDKDSCKYWDVLEKKICGRTGRRTGTCHGDSGGPLTIEGQLAGITTGSPSDTCGKPDEPMIFTSVFFHKDWIERNIEDLDA